MINDTYYDYLQRHDIGYTTDELENIYGTIQEALGRLQDQGLPCPKTVLAVYPSKVTFYVEAVLVDLQEALRVHPAAGPDYQIPEEGRTFLRWALRLYNTKHAGAGPRDRYDLRPITVPPALRYKGSSK